MIDDKTKRFDVLVDPINERVILATMIQNAEVRRRLSRELRPEEFSDPRNTTIFRGLVQLERAGLAWSEGTFASIADPKQFDGMGYVRKLLETYEPNQNVDHHIHRLRVDSARIELLATILPEAARKCADPKLEMDTIRSLGRALVRRADIGARHYKTSAETVDAYAETLRTRKMVGGLFDATGHSLLDRILTRGWAAPGLSIIVGRPAQGKSTITADLIRRRLELGKSVHLCAWEPEVDPVLDMMVASETGIPVTYLTKRIGELSEEQRRQIAAIMYRIKKSDLLTTEGNPFLRLPKMKEKFSDVNERNLDFFEAMVEQISKRTTFIVVDVVMKMLPDRRPDKVTEALVRIGGMAKEYNVHFCLLHHLNRAGAEGRPSLEHIKNSGAFEEESDVVIAVDRPLTRASVRKRANMPDCLDLLLLKQRYGPFPAVIRYAFDGARSRLSNEEMLDISMLEQDEAEPGSKM